MASPLTAQRLTVTIEAQTDIKYALDRLEESIVAGYFRNDSPELIKALAGLRQAQTAVRDLELFTRSAAREGR